MKNFFNKIKSYSFWVSFSAALIMLLNALGKAFGFEIQNQIVEDCVMSIAGILVVFGLVSNKNDKTLNDINDANKDDDLKENEKDLPLENDLNDEEFNNENDKQ